MVLYLYFCVHFQLYWQGFGCPRDRRHTPWYLSPSMQLGRCAWIVHRVCKDVHAITSASRGKHDEEFVETASAMVRFLVFTFLVRSIR